MIYRNSKGKFISKEEWLSLQPKQNTQMSNNKKKRTKKITLQEQEKIIKDNFPTEIQPVIQEEALNPEFVETINTIEESLDKEWIGEGATYKQEVIELEQSIEKAFDIQGTNIPSAVVDTKTEKTPGFFTTWFKKWIW